MLSIAIEIIICICLGIGLILALVFCKSVDQKRSDDDEQKTIQFLPVSINEDLLVQNVLIAYYEQQRNELIERQKVPAYHSTVDMSIIKNNDSGYTSIPSPSHSPHSLYECTGFASMDNLEVLNPLFTSDINCDHKQTYPKSSSIKK